MLWLCQYEKDSQDPSILVYYCRPKHCRHSLIAQFKFFKFRVVWNIWIGKRWRGRSTRLAAPRKNRSSSLQFIFSPADNSKSHLPFTLTYDCRRSVFVVSDRSNIAADKIKENHRPRYWSDPTLSEFAKRELMGSKKKRGETVDSMKTIIAKMKAFLGKFKKLWIFLSPGRPLLVFLLESRNYSDFALCIAIQLFLTTIAGPDVVEGTAILKESFQKMEGVSLNGQSALVSIRLLEFFSLLWNFDFLLFPTLHP